MIVTILAIASSTPMDPQTVVLLTVAPVLLGCKREDHVVETLTRNIKNNVILHVSVDILTGIALYLVLVIKETQIKINKTLIKFQTHHKPIALIQMIIKPPQKFQNKINKINNPHIRQNKINKSKLV